tara:strand:- start:65475 stop:68414 length:2940 start_codon:yes stop_codon:yes gene_type:complete
MSKRLLNDTEACIHLGITKELLYAYVRNVPKKALDHNRKLISEEVNGKNMFDVSELDSFDAYLKDPWSNEGGKRPDIPSYIQDYLKTEIGGKCPITEKGFPLENAHIEDYSVSKSHHHHNIIRIAKDEHTKFDKGVLSKELLKKTKSSLIENIRRNLRLENEGDRLSFGLPKPYHLFIGRDLELLKVTSLMEIKRLLVIQGIGGVGKTQLLLNAINSVNYHNPVLWIDIETISTINDLILVISNEIAKIIDKPIMTTLIDTIASLQITIVLDSLEKLLIPYRDKTEDFIQLLMTQTDNVQLLITSQIDLSIFDNEKALINLHGVSDSSSKSILNHLVNEKNHVEEQQLNWIINFCGGHPLSLKLISSLINFYKNCDVAINHLKKTNSLKQPLRVKHSKSTALSICLDTIYSSLNKDQKKILHYSKFFPAGSKEPWIKGDLNLPDFDTDLAVLQQFFLVNVNIDTLNFRRILIQNPIRKFLYDHAIGSSIESHNKYEKKIWLNISIEAMLVDHNYIETSLRGSAEYGISRIETELPNIMEAFYLSKKKLENSNIQLTKKDQDDFRLIMGNIASSLGKFFFVRGFFKQGVSIAKEGIKISLELQMFESAATQYMYLSQIQSRQHNLKGFTKTIEDLYNLTKLTNDEYVNICYNWLKARLHSINREFKVSLSYFNKVITMLELRIKKSSDKNDFVFNTELWEMTKVQSKGNIGLVYTEIAKIYESSQDYEKALKYYKKGLNIQLSLKDEVNAFSCYYQIANCNIELRRPNKAIKYYFICVEGFLRHGNHEYLANTLAELGRQSETHPEVLKNKLLTGRVFELALDNLTYRLYNFVDRQRSINANTESIIQGIPHELIGQMTLLTMLVSLSEHKDYLYDWAIDLNEGLKYTATEINIFSTIINLAHAIGSVDYWKEKPQNESQLPLNTILQSCLIINGGPDLKSKTRIFYWLAQWMQHMNLDKEATAVKLWDKAWNSFENTTI